MIYKTIQFDPLDRSYREHEDLKCWPVDQDQVNRLAAAMLERGELIPHIKVCGKIIVDGRHHWRAAKQAQLKTVTAFEVPKEEVGTIIFETLINRRHTSKGGKAFFAVRSGQLDAAFRESSLRKAQNGPKHGHSIETNSVRFDRTLEEWADKCGLDVRLLQQARELVDLFGAHARETWTITDRDNVTEDEVTFEDFFAPRIMRDENPYGLGHVLTAVKQLIDIKHRKGGKHTGGKPAELHKQVALVAKIATDTLNRADTFAKLSAEERTDLARVLRVESAKKTPEERAAAAELLTWLADLARKAAKE